MKAFDYAAPSSVEDAVKLLAAPQSEALSGGTDLLGRLKDYVSEPARVVYLKDVKSLAGISGSATGEGLTIGAGTLLVDVLAHQGLRQSYPALWQATLEVGTPQIRNMATVGGNLAEVLQTVADTMLARNRLKGEIRALTAEGRISAVVLGSLPFFLGGFLWFTNRDYLQPLLDSTAGRIAIVVGLLLMGAGIYWLQKIVDIEV